MKLSLTKEAFPSRRDHFWKQAVEVFDDKLSPVLSWPSPTSFKSSGKVSLALSKRKSHALSAINLL